MCVLGRKEFENLYIKHYSRISGIDKESFGVFYSHKIPKNSQEIILESIGNSQKSAFTLSFPNQRVKINS